MTVPALRRGPPPPGPMAVRGGGGGSAPTPFSIQAILNKKEERAGRAGGRLPPAGGAAPAGCWRLFGGAGLAAADEARRRGPAGWDSDEALSDDHEGERRSEEDEGAQRGPPGGSARPREAPRRGRPAPDAAPPEREEEPPGLSDSEMSAGVAGTAAADPREARPEGRWGPAGSPGGEERPAGGGTARSRGGACGHPAGRSRAGRSVRAGQRRERASASDTEPPARLPAPGREEAARRRGGCLGDGDSPGSLKATGERRWGPRSPEPSPAGTAQRAAPGRLCGQGTFPGRGVLSSRAAPGVRAGECRGP